MKNKNIILRLLVLCVLAGWTAAALGAPPSVLYYQPFDDGMTGTIWLQGQGGSTWNPYFSGGPNGTPAGSMALFHNHLGTYCPISYQAPGSPWAYYWTRPTVNNVFTVPAGTNEVTISYDFWRCPSGWTLYPYFAGWVQFTDNVTYPDEYFSTTSTGTGPGWQSISQTLTYSGDKVVASIKLHQINTQFYNNVDGGVFIDNFTFAYDNLKIVVSGPPQNCAEAMAQGYEIAGDLTDDCRVDFEDIESLAATWLDCMIPGEARCGQLPWE